MEHISNHKKRNYIYFLVFTFLAMLVIEIIVSPEAAHEVTLIYTAVITLTLAILAFAYVLAKTLFHSQARNKNDELHLKELPADQDDINNTH